jgi:Tannase and feruloyl esterase
VTFNTLTQFERFKGMAKPEFDRAIEALTPQDVLQTGEAQLTKVQQYHRLFMVPNMGHCTQVGAGPSEIGGGAAEPPKAQRTTDTHVVNAVMRWVEQGIAPTQIIATRTDKDGAVVRQRPLCAYPAQAVYSGQGDVNQANSFRCETPKIEDRPLSETDMILIKSSLRQREFKLPNR